MEALFDCAKCAAVYGERVGWCTACGGFGTVLPRAYRPAETLWGSPAPCVSARHLLAGSARTLTSSSYPDLRLPPAGLVLLFGAPGAGKSTMLFKLLDGVAGTVLLSSLEEGLAGTVVDRLKRLEIHRDDFLVSRPGGLVELDALLRQRAPVAVGIDSVSVSTLQADDLVRLVSDFAVLLVGTMHVNSQGAAAGQTALLHAADVVLELDAMNWRTVKTRFSGGVDRGEV